MFLSPELLDSHSFTVFSMGTVTPGAVAAAVCAEQSFLVPATSPPLRVTDYVDVQVVASGNASAFVSARVIDSTHIGLTYCNPTAGALTPAAGVATAVVVRL